MPIYSEELQEQLARIDRLQAQIDALRPLPADVQARIFQKFRLDWNYHSNSIEGNSLTYGETVAFIMEGVTANNKPLKDHLDLRGHDQAIEVLLTLIKDPEAELTERDIRELHHIIMVEPYEMKVETAAGHQTRRIEPGQYKTTPNHTRTATGAIHYYATPEETPSKMHDLIEWYRTHRTTLHPLVLAARFHHRFVSIHPFPDGNGRMTRLLTNMLLMKSGYPPIVVKTEERREYYAVLSQADAGVEAPLLEYFAERLIRSLEIYLKGTRGEDISDLNDIDKEIALLKASFEQEDIVNTAINLQSINTLIINSFIPLFMNISEKIKQLRELFLTFNSSIHTIENNSQSKYTNSVYDRMTHGSIETSGAVPRLISYLNEQNPQNLTIVFSWTLRGFKKSLSPFDLTEEMRIDFSEYQYTINTFVESEEISKLYNNPLTSIDTNNITTLFIRRFIKSINNRRSNS